MRRFTILGRMGLVLTTAVAIAALRNAYDYWAGGSNVTLGPAANTVTTTTTTQFAVASTVGGDTSARWKSLLPGAANYEAFNVVGHCLFALLAGLLGMFVAKRYQARQERALETDPVADSGFITT